MEKYRLVIVDDEYLVRLGLKETIDWTDIGVEVVGDYVNGAEALEGIRELKPDVVICDVRMPIMDGLELSETLYSENFDGAVILYSGYSDFEYARKALSLGVSAYIVKPADNVEIVSAVKNTVERLAERRRQRSRMSELEQSIPLLRENLVSNFLSCEGGVETAERLRALGVPVPRTGIAIYVRAQQIPDETFDELREVTLRALEGFDSVSCNFGTHFVVVTSMTDGQVMRDFLRGRLAESENTGACRVAVGISDAFAADDGIFAEIERAKERSESVVIPFVNAIVCDDTVTKTGEESGRLVRDAMEIITKDFDKKLSIKKTAGRLYVSESHLMHEFKKITGKTFNECLTEYRMIRACEYLKAGEHVNVVAEKVGYSDVRYFSQVFRETIGVMPAEYIQRNRRP